MASKEDLIYDIIKEIRSDVKCVQKDLNDHMARTRLAEKKLEIHRKLHESTEKRVTSLEEPGKAWKYIGKLIVWVAGILTAVYTIVKFLP